MVLKCLVFTWTSFNITGFFFLVRTTTCLATIFGRCDYCPCSFLHSFSTRLGTFCPFTPGRLPTIHFGGFTRFATIPFHPGCVISTATVSIINQLPAVSFFILTLYYPRQKEIFCKMNLISAFEIHRNLV